MECKGFIRDALTALNKAISIPQAEEPIAGHIGEARSWLEAALLAKPSEEEKDQIHLWQCWMLCLTSDYDEAYELFQRVNLGRETPTTWQEIGAFIYAKMILPTDLAKGLEEYDQVLNWAVFSERKTDLAAIKAILYGRKAFYHLKMTRYADAIACCEISSELLPEHLAPLRIMAEIKLSRGEYENAIEYLSRAIALRTEGPHFWDYANRGSAFLETSHVQAAFRDLSTALELEPQNHVVLSNLGMAYEQIKNTREAWRHYSLALRSYFHSVPAHNNRGTLFFSERDFRQAEIEFSTAVQLEPGNALLWFNRGLARFEMQMYGECLSDMAMSIQVGNKTWEAAYVWGMCKGRLKEYSTAIAILRNLVLKSSLDREDNSLIWNNIGVMEHRMDRLETAHRCFLEATGENPLNDQAQANVEKIESTMSGETLLGTEESTVEITPRVTTGNPLSLTQSDLINTVSIAANMAAMASQHLA